MSETPITVTEAARSFSDCVNRAFYQNQSFLLTKNGVPVARLVPVRPTACTGRDLAKAVERVELSNDESSRWGADLKRARKTPKKPTDKWR